jgi:signal peptidase
VNRTTDRRAPLSLLVRRFGRLLGNALIVVAMVVCVAWMAPTLFGYTRYVITGGSMSGSFEKGSIAFEKPVPVGELKTGDVITYMPPPDSGVPNLVTHRIVDMQPAEGGGTLFTTKGDANLDPDPWRFQLTSPTQPVVQFTVPHIGWLFVALGDREVRMLLIGVPAGLVGLIALGQLLGALRGGREDATTREPLITAPQAPITSLPAQRAPSEAPAKVLA